MLDRRAYPHESVAEILAPVTGNEHHAARSVETRRVVPACKQLAGQPAGQLPVAPDPLHHRMQRVDHRIARHQNLPGIDSLTEQIPAREFRRGEMIRSDPARDLAVHLLGPRAVYVVRAQSRLDVSDRNAAVKGGQCGGRRGRRVAVNQHHVRTGLVEHVAHARQHAGSHVVEILSLPHNVQIVVGLDSEQPQHLIEHLAVLSADADDRPEKVRMPSELPYQRGHFDRLGTSPENQHHLFH